MDDDEEVRHCRIIPSTGLDMASSQAHYHHKVKYHVRRDIDRNVFTVSSWLTDKEAYAEHVKDMNPPFSNLVITE